MYQNTWQCFYWDSSDYLPLVHIPSSSSSYTSSSSFSSPLTPPLLFPLLCLCCLNNSSSREELFQENGVWNSYFGGSGSLCFGSLPSVLAVCKKSSKFPGSLGKHIQLELFGSWISSELTPTKILLVPSNTEFSILGEAWQASILLHSEGRANWYTAPLIGLQKYWHQGKTHTLTRVSIENIVCIFLLLISLGWSFTPWDVTANELFKWKRLN